MTISTMDQLVAGLDNGFQSRFWKTTFSTASPQSGWSNPGSPGAPGAPPTGAGEVPTEATQGALYYTAAGGGLTNYLAALQLTAAGEGIFLLYDRLVHTSGLVGNVTTAQTVSSVAVNRPDTTGSGAELFLEVYTALGATVATATVSYTNQSGTAGQTATAAVTASLPKGGLVPVTLAAGDTGVQTVQTVTLSASTGIAGNFGITIGRRLAVPPMSIPTTSTAVNSTYPQDGFALGLPAMGAHACLWLIAYGTNVAQVFGNLAFAQG